MILSCPQCHANFNLDDAVLGNEGRKVKCGKCGHRWRAIPDVLLDKPISEPDDDILTSARQEEKAVEADPFTDLTNNTDGAEGGILADQITTSNGNESFSSHARSQSGLEDTLAKGAGEESIKATKPISRISKWIILTVAVATILLGIIFRTDLARIYPPIEKIFQLIDIPVKPFGYGLKLSNTISTPKQEGDDSGIVISGEIENTLSSTISVPSLKGDFYDPKGAIIFTHHFKADFQEILPGEKIKYRTEIKNPPSDSVRIEITFTKN